MQIGLALCAGALLVPALGRGAAVSALLAGTISALSTWYTGSKVFGSSAASARQFVRNLYLAHLMKILLVIALCCIVFATLPVNFPVFIITYAATLGVYAWALAMGMRTRRG